MATRHGSPRHVWDRVVALQQAPVVGPSGSFNVVRLARPPLREVTLRGPLATPDFEVDDGGWGLDQVVELVGASPVSFEDAIQTAGRARGRARRSGGAAGEGGRAPRRTPPHRARRVRRRTDRGRRHGADDGHVTQIQLDVLAEVDRDWRFKPAELGVEVDDGIVTMLGTASSSNRIVVK